jgi:rhodanese-related sulfurtransferase
VLVDVRTGEAYSTGHIRASISLPEAEIPMRVQLLPKDKKIITYCA